VATRDDVGTSKALCLKKHFSMIYPECQIDAKVQLYDASSEAEILSGQPDFVLDCIDNIDTKVTNTSIQTSTFIFLYVQPPILCYPHPPFCTGSYRLQVLACTSFLLRFRGCGWLTCDVTP